MNETDTAEFIIANLVSELKEGMTVVQGTSEFIPLVATAIAQMDKKINVIGGFASNTEIAPKYPTTFSPFNYKNGQSFLGLSGFVDLIYHGKVDLEFLRPAQVDRYGNMNNTVIGNYSKPKVRLPGGMGIGDVMCLVKNIILYVPDHNQKVFVEKVDFVTANGWDLGKGPNKIITNLCVFEFLDGNITLTKISPNSTIEAVKGATGFEFEISKNVEKMNLPDKKLSEKIKKIDPLNLRNLDIKDKREETIRNF